MAKYLSEDGLRYFYNQIKSKFAAANHNHDAGNVTSGTLPITRGGTGQTTAAGVRNALGLGNTTGAVPVANGGTGATSVAEAVKALLGSSSIGSSTKPLYYDGATLKACADSIGGGGIVAQLLKQNGYVKFANGLILQWGKIDGNNARWYYPIIFKTLFYAQVAGDREEVDAARATKVSMVTFAGNDFLSFYTDYVGGTNRFIVLGF